MTWYTYGMTGGAGVDAIAYIRTRCLMLCISIAAGHWRRWWLSSIHTYRTPQVFLCVWINGENLFFLSVCFYNVLNFFFYVYTFLSCWLSAGSSLPRVFFSADLLATYRGGYPVSNKQANKTNRLFSSYIQQTCDDTSSHDLLYK